MSLERFTPPCPVQLAMTLKLNCLLPLLATGLALPLAATEIVGHRGASHDAPENSLSAMKLAWEQGADGAELDLWLSKDDRLVVMHDGSTKRTGGLDKKIADQTWEELQKLDIGAWKDAKFKGEKIPTLESILESTPAGKKMVLEIKCGPEILPALGKVIKASPLYPKQLVIISFNYEVMKQSKPLFPEVEHYLLAGYKKDKETGKLPELSEFVEKAKAAKLDGLDLNHGWPIDDAFVKGLKDQGLKLITWTVNDPAVAKQHVKAGVDAITTDRPAYLRENALGK
jgi:glycerophosphoryl diester phosphodiesterase